MSNESFRIPLINLEVERKTDLLALTALILALAGILFQLVGYFRGAEVKLFRPEQVLIVFDAYSDGQEYVRINARMAYVNTGQPGFNATVRRESVRFGLGGVTYEQIWQDFQGFDSKGKQIVPRLGSDAKPEPVMAGSALSHETYFAPHPVRCDPSTPCETYRNFLDWNRFVTLVAREKRLEFEFVGEIYGESQAKVARCSVDLDDNLIIHLTLHRWAAPVCL